jgi:hypothetical protein
MKVGISSTFFWCPRRKVLDLFGLEPRGLPSGLQNVAMIGLTGKILRNNELQVRWTEGRGLADFWVERTKPVCASCFPQ